MKVKPRTETFTFLVCMLSFKAFSFEGWEEGLEINFLVSNLVFCSAVLHSNSKINYCATGYSSERSWPFCTPGASPFLFLQERI